MRASRWDELWGDPKLVDPVTRTGQGARGLYFNEVVVKRLGAEGVIRAVHNAHLDAAVIDLKTAKDACFTIPRSIS